MHPQTFHALPVVLIPGLGLGAESWAPTVRALHQNGTIDQRHVRILLLPGYGRPHRDRSQLTPEALARAALGQLALDPPGLMVGLSAGCQVAAHLALQAPDRVAVLVLVGPTTDPRAQTWPLLLRRWMATALCEPIGQLPALVRQYRRTGPVTMFRAMDAARRDRLEQVLHRLGCPTLAVRGRHDRIAPHDWLLSLTEQLDGSAGHGPQLRRAASLAAGAHMVPHTHGELLAIEIERFLADIGGIVSL